MIRRHRDNEVAERSVHEELSKRTGLLVVALKV